ncbi:MAG TPA: ABC transporter substrate-binding protein [Casimicrobiaceae bacterium]|nr:ABC transporter substrate-binding protein [Casimicrobiaceae bacterium]
MLRDRLIRRLAAFVAAVAVATASSLAQAQDTKVSFQLDWRFEGPAALFLLAKAKGYFAAEKLDVTIDAGNGSGNAVNRVASGTYQMGFADLAALIEFVGNNPTAPNKPVAVMIVYDDTPAAVFALKKAGIAKPADLVGRKMGAPVFDAGRRAFPIFARANGIDATKVNWTAMDPPLRETMLAKGDVDAITGFYFTSLLNLNARGVKDEDIVVLPYPKYGVKLYGNAIIVSETFLKEKPEAVKGFLRAFAKGVRDVLADPDASIKYVKERDALIDEALEKRRLKLAIESVIATPAAKADGIGEVNPARLADMVTQVTSAFELKNPVKADAIFSTAFLPPKAERMVFPK